jgi:RHS repeat-associated protein
MNARLYDPVLERILAVDYYVSDPTISEYYNRYSYVMNNPLKYNDPNVEF